MRILALDTSCDETAASIVDAASWRLLADEVASHADRMADFGGVVPELASRAHLIALPLVVARALEKAGMQPADLDAIAVTNGPGLVGALLVGTSYGKALALRLGKPFRAVDHIEGHLYSPLLGALEGAAAPPFPWVALVVSGGHTELYYVESFGKKTRLGSTIDDAAGEAFDKIGKLLGFPYPAGPEVDRYARENEASRSLGPKLPVARTANPFDFSYSGLKTAVLQAWLQDPTEEKKRALVPAAQEAIVAQLVDRVRRAQQQYKPASLVVAGGVAANSRLRALLPEATYPRLRHCADNAAMIALVAALEHRSGTFTPDPWDKDVFARGD